jgi:MFS family permease
VSPTFHSLRRRNYRYYASGALVTNVGTWMQRIAQDWLVLQLTAGSATALGITTGLQFLPMLLFGMFGGVIADRFPKRRVLAVTNTFMATTALILGVLVLTGWVQVWHVYVLAFSLGLGTAIDNPARQSFVVEIVGREDLPNAVGLNSASFNLARIMGPAAAGFLIAAFGGDATSTGPVFLINALSYGAMIIALRTMNGADLRPSPRTLRGSGQLREGVRYVLARKDLSLVLVIVFFAGTFGLNFQIFTALMATQVFERGADDYGLLGSILAIGSLSGSLLAARRGRPRIRLLVGAAIAFGLFVMAAGLMPSYWVFAVSLIPVGFFALTLITSANATMQLGVDPLMRGRVMALYMVVFFGGTPIGAPIVGLLAETFGARSALLAGGAITVLGTVVATTLLASREKLEIRAHLRPHPHVTVRDPTIAPAPEEVRPGPIDVDAVTRG